MMRGNRYKIAGVLGEGGMGKVYLVEDLHLPGKKWAMKQIRSGKFGGGGGPGTGEAAALVRLSHPGLPHVADYFESEDGASGFLVMEHVEGKTMEQLFVDEGRRLPAEQVLRWAVQLCDVLGYLHGRRPPVVHRDLKPSNVIITGQDRVVLIDFGISRLDAGKGQDTVKLGTIGFAAPELLAGGRTGPASDLYGLGAVMFYLLSGGKFPPAAPGEAAEQLADVPPALRHAVAKLLNPEPEHRFPDAGSVKAALLQMLAGSGEDPAGGMGGNGGGRKRVLALLSLYPGAGSTVIGLAAAALLRRHRVAHAYLEHPAAEPVLDAWLDPAVREEGRCRTAWLTAALLEERYGTWNEANQLHLLYETDTRVMLADLSHGWAADTAENLLALADETVIVAGPRHLQLTGRPVRERLRKAAMWLEAGRAVSLIWNGALRRPPALLRELPFRSVLHLPPCPGLPDWEGSGDPQALLVDRELSPWADRLEAWLLSLCGDWGIPAGGGKRRLFSRFKKGIDNPPRQGV